MPLAWNDLRGLSVGVLGVGAEGLKRLIDLTN